MPATCRGDQRRELFDLPPHQSGDLEQGQDHRPPAEMLPILVARMGTDGHAMLQGQLYGVAHRPLVARVTAAGDVRRSDQT